jgi:hypothetical protein
MSGDGLVLASSYQSLRGSTEKILHRSHKDNNPVVFFDHMVGVLWREFKRKMNDESLRHAEPDRKCPRKVLCLFYRIHNFIIVSQRTSGTDFCSFRFSGFGYSFACVLFDS